MSVYVASCPLDYKSLFSTTSDSTRCSITANQGKVTVQVKRMEQRMKNLLPHCITPHTVPNPSARSFSEAAACDLGSAFNVQDKGSRARLTLHLGNHHSRLRLQEGGILSCLFWTKPSPTTT